MSTYPDPQQLNFICSQIEQQGYVVIDQAVPEKLSGLLLDRLKAAGPDAFEYAGIGRKQDFQTNENIRSDQILWLDDNLPEAQSYLAWIEQLRLVLNRRFYLGLIEYECMFAHYAAGAFYKKHLDAFRGSQSSNRKVSTILYLNRDWQTTDGGELLLYREDQQQPFLKVLPELGKLVIFLSEEFPHEVLPARKSRFSLTGWFRVKA